MKLNLKTVKQNVAVAALNSTRRRVTAPRNPRVWAPWCGPCRIVGPIVDQLAAESNGRYRVAKLNVDDNPQTASRYQIGSIPTLLIFKNGAVIDRIVGAQPKQAIVAQLNQALSKTA